MGREVKGRGGEWSHRHRRSSNKGSDRIMDPESDTLELTGCEHLDKAESLAFD